VARNDEPARDRVFVKAADDRFASEGVAFVHVGDLVRMTAKELAGLLFFASA
jgi:hypothetical protein